MKQLKTPVVVERRRRKRILTKRNIGIGVVVMLVIVAGFNIRSEMRDSTGDDYGRLYQRELQKAPVVEPNIVAGSEVAPVDEQASADPFALDAAAREQYLGTTPLQPEPVVSSAVTYVPASTAGESELKIVGGPDGVTIEQERRHAPVLGGGFGRRQ
jgi:hypothetical protein